MLISSGVLFFKYSCKNSEIWFLKPPIGQPENSANGICRHRGCCGSYIFEGVKKFFTLGIAIEIARSTLSSVRLFKTGHWTITKHMSNMNFGLTSFLVSYIGIYRSIHCLMNNKFGRDSNMANCIAAYLSGGSFFFWPNIKILILAFSILAQSSWNYLVNVSRQEKKMSFLQMIDKLPLDVLIWTVFLSMAFRYRIFTPYYVSSYGKMAMDLISGEL
jgi:hypothetical protein